MNRYYSKQTRIIVFITGFILLCYVIFILTLFSIDIPWPQKGQFGDSFGAITSTVSAIALIGVITSILLQREELIAVHQQVDLMKDEMKQQNSTLSLQAFENLFFRTLMLFNEVIENISVQSHQETHAGRSGLRVIAQDCRVSIMKLINAKNGKEIDGYVVQELVEQAYYGTYNAYPHILGHYFRTLYNVIKIVDKSTLSDSEKKIYTNIVRSQLSSDDLILLYANGLAGYGVKFRPLVIKYSLLKHLDGQIKGKKSLTELYPKNTYK